MSSFGDFWGQGQDGIFAGALNSIDSAQSEDYMSALEDLLRRITASRLFFNSLTNFPCNSLETFSFHFVSFGTSMLDLGFRCFAANRWGCGIELQHPSVKFKIAGILAFGRGTGQSDVLRPACQVLSAHTGQQNPLPRSRSIWDAYLQRLRNDVWFRKQKKKNRQICVNTTMSIDINK